MKRLITVEHFQGPLSIRMTQRYMETYKGGHYEYVIMKDRYHVLHVSATGGGPPLYTISEALAADKLRQWILECDAEDMETYGLAATDASDTEGEKK